MMIRVHHLAVEFVLIFLAPFPAYAIDEVNFSSVFGEKERIVDFSRERSRTIDTAPFYDFFLFGSDFAADGTLGGRTGTLVIETQILPVQKFPGSPLPPNHTEINRHWLTARDGQDTYAGLAPIAVGFAQQVCAVGVSLYQLGDYTREGARNNNLVFRKRTELTFRFLAADGSEIETETRFPNDIGLQIAFEVGKNDPLISGVVITSTASQGLGIESVIAIPCAQLTS